MSEGWNAIRAIKGAGLLLVAGILAWRALVTNLADYYASEGTSEAAVGALRWRGDQPAALYQRGVALAASAPVDARRWLRAAAGPIPPMRWCIWRWPICGSRPGSGQRP